MALEEAAVVVGVVQFPGVPIGPGQATCSLLSSSYRMSSDWLFQAGLPGQWATATEGGGISSWIGSVFVGVVIAKASDSMLEGVDIGVEDLLC